MQCHRHVVVGQGTETFNNRKCMGFAQWAGDQVTHSGDWSTFDRGCGAAGYYDSAVAGGVAEQYLCATLNKGP